MYVSPTGRSMNGENSWPVRLTFTVTVLPVTIGRTPPSRLKHRLRAA